MASKKVYAVKIGKTTGIFTSWDECKASVDGFPGAQYKGFSSLAEAESYLGIVSSKEDTLSVEDIPPKGRLLAYVDGSYEDSIKKYAFGCVFIQPDGRIYTEYGNGDNPQSLQHRNVTGEMLGAMYATRVAMKNGYQEVEIRFDYEGIQKWATGEWKCNHELTKKYAQAMKEWGKEIRILFTKVAAHSNVRFNELADSLAKEGLEAANGVPAVKKLEEMKIYGADSVE